MLLKFELSMPTVGSWNGRDAGAKPNLFIFKTVKDEKAKQILGKSFSYNFGDGWSASVKVSQVKSRTKSDGFRDYDWMVSEIIQHGRILKKEERNFSENID